MNCKHCGGTIDSQTVECPYCGSVNQAGEEFQAILNKRIKKNNALKKAIYDLQTPDLIETLLSKTILAQIVLIAVIVGIATYLLIAHDDICDALVFEKAGVFQEDSYAAILGERYTKELGADSTYGVLVDWNKNAYDFMDEYESGATIKDYEIRPMVLNAMNILNADSEAYSTPALETAVAEVEILFVDVLGFTDEEMELFDYGEEPAYGAVFTEQADMIVALVRDKVDNREVAYNE